MDIYVLNLNAEILGIVDNFKSIIWTRQWFGQGDFQLVVPATDKHIDLLQKDRLLCRDQDRTSNRFDNVMLIENIGVVTDWENGNTITVTGRSLKNIIGRRIVWKQMNLTGNAESSIQQVITDNIINPEDTGRKISNFILADAVGITDTLDAQLLGENIAEWLESVSNTYGFGWDVFINDKKFVFTLLNGTDRSYNQTTTAPVVFSPEFDNLLSSNYSYGRAEYKNAALVGGEGEGINRRTATIGDSTGLDRYETFVDGSSVSSNGEIITVEQYTKLLEDYGKDQLGTTAYTEKFDGTTVPDGNYVLNTDYFLGDVVQVVNEYGISATPRIIEIIESEDENGTTTVPTFSTWEV